MTDDAAWLRIGDSVSLFCEDVRGFMISENSVNPIATIKPAAAGEKQTPNVSNFQACVFQILVPNKYKANKKYYHMKKKFKEPTTAEQTMLYNQKKLATAETEDNNQEQARQLGKFITYGMSVQLYHTYSGKYLSGSSSDAAVVENTNMCVELMEYNTKTCWFRIMPRYKVRAEGDIVREGDQISLESIKTPGSFIHASRKTFDEDCLENGLHEVNLSVSQSGFSILRYSRPDETLAQIAASKGIAAVTDEDAVPVRGGDVLRLFHREVEAHISAEGSFLDGIKENVHLRVRHYNSKKPHTAKPPTGSSVFWQIEIDGELTRGSRLRWGQLVRFKHFLTRQYLSIKKNASTGAYYVTLTSDHRDPDAVFRPHAVIKDRDFMEYGNFARLEHPVSKTWLHCDRTPYVRTKQDMASSIGEDATDPITKAALISAKPMTEIPYDKAKLIQLKVDAMSHYDDAFTLTQVKRKDVNAINLVAGAAPIIHWYNQNREKGVELTSAEADTVTRAVELFTDMIVVKGIPNKRRQKILRHLRIVDLLIEALRIPFSPYNSKGFPITNLPEFEHRYVRQVCVSIYECLTAYVQGTSRKNEFYIARFIPFIFAQIGCGLSATNILTELASDNNAIVDRIQPAMVDFFLNSLSKKHNSRFLDFLTACCSVHGGAIPKNQDYICDALVTRATNGVLFGLRIQNGALEVETKPGFWVNSAALAKDKSMAADYDFFLSQIALLSEVTFGRNAKTAAAVKSKFLNWDLVFTCVKSKDVPYKARSSFAEALRNLYVDVDPYDDLLERVKLTFDLPSLRASVKKRSDVTTLAHEQVQSIITPQLRELRDWINEFLRHEEAQVASEKARNKFVETIFDIVDYLVSFGVYSTKSELISLLHPLLRVLDGGDDKASPDQPEDERQDWLLRERYAKSAENKAMVNAKYKALEVLELVFNFQVNARLEEFVVAYDTLEQHSLTGKGAATLGRTFKKSAAPVSPELLELAEFTKSAGDYNKAKKVLAHNFASTNFLDPFPDLPLVKVLLDMANYEYTKMCTQAHFLITRFYSQHSDFFHYLMDAQVLILDESVRVQRRVAEILPGIRRLVRSTLDKKQEDTLKGYISELCTFLYLKEEPSEPHAINQTILFNAGVLVDLFDVLSKPMDVNLKEYDGLREIFGLCFKVFGLLARQNPVVQERLFDRLDFLIDVEGAEKAKARALCSVFKDNESNCIQIKESQIARVVELLAEFKLPEYLQLLAAIIRVDKFNLTLKRNQNAIVKYMMQNRDETIIGVDDDKNEERLALLRSDSEKPSLELRYHLELVDLLATCAEGENRFIESMCQTIFSPTELLEVFNDPKIAVLHKAPYLRFLLWVYLSTAGEDVATPEMNDLPHDEDFWKFIASATSLVRKDAELLQVHKTKQANQREGESLEDPIDEDEMDFIIDGIIPFTTVFFDKYFDTDTAQSAQKTAAFELAKAILSFFSVASVQIKSSSDLKTISTCLLTLSSKLALPDAFNEKLQKELSKSNSFGGSSQVVLSDALKKHLKKHDQENTINDNMNAMLVNLQVSYEKDPICPYYKAKDINLPLGEEFQHHVEIFADFGTGKKKEFKAVTPAMGKLIAVLEGSVKLSSSMSEKDRAAQELLDIRCLHIINAIIENEKARLQTHEKMSGEEAEYMWSRVEIVQNALAKYRAALVSTKLYSSPSDEVVAAALAVTVAMLDGGNKVVQKNFERYFVNSREETFFSDVRYRINKSSAAVKEQRALVALKAKEEQKRNDLTSTLAKHNAGGHHHHNSDGAGAGVGPVPSEGDISVTLSKEESGGGIELSPMSSTKGQDIQEAIENAGLSAQVAEDEAGLNAMLEETEKELRLVLRLLQLLCEGNNVFLKDYIREQADNIKSYNLVKDTANYLQVLYHSINSENSELVAQVLATLVEFSQGNPENQVCIFDAKVLDAVNLILRQHDYTGLPCPEVADIKQLAGTLVLAMIEEKNERSAALAKELHTQLDIRAVHENINRYYYESKFAAQLGYDPEEDPDPTEVGYTFYAILARLTDETETNYFEKPYVYVPEKKYDKFGVAIKDPKAKDDDMSKKLDSNKAVKLQHIKLVSVSTTGTVHGTVHGTMHGTMSGLGGAKAAALNAAKANNPNAKKTSFKVLPSNLYLKAPSLYHIFAATSATIEVVKDDAVSKIHFLVKNKDALREKTKQELLWSVDRSSPTDKIRDFMIQISEIRANMKYQQQLLANPVSAIFVKNSNVFYYTSILLSLLLNIFILAGWDANPNDPLDWRPITPDWYNPCLFVFGGAHVFVSLCIFFEYFLTSPPTSVSELFSLSCLYYIAFLGLSIAGIIVRGYFFCFHLLHVVVGNDLLQRVIQSVTKNGKSLLWVTALGVIVIYIYSIAAFAFLRDDYAADGDGNLWCNNAWQCFLTTLTVGLISGLTPPHAEIAWNPIGIRILFDLSFFVLISTIALNVIFGIIVDTFSELRDEKWQIEEDMTSNCFICSIKAYDFDKYTKGFVHHIKNEHYMWNYLFFTIHLEDKDPSDYNALELYCAKKFASVDTSIFPINRALSLAKTEDELQNTLTSIQRSIQFLVSRFEREDRMKIEQDEKQKQKQWEEERGKKN